MVAKESGQERSVRRDDAGVEVMEFEKFEEKLPGLPLNRIGREDFAFLGTNIVPEALMGEYHRFAEQWRARYGAQKVAPIREGWYSTTVKVVEKAIKEGRQVSDLFDESTLQKLSMSWEQVFPGKGNECPCLILVGGNGLLRSVEGTMMGHRMELTYHNANLPWAVRVGDRFYAFVCQIGSIARIMRVIEYHNGNSPQGDTEAVFLEWIRRG